MSLESKDTREFKEVSLLDATRSMHYLTGVRVNLKRLRLLLAADETQPTNLLSLATATINHLTDSPICCDNEKSWGVALSSIGFQEVISTRSTWARPVILLARETIAQSANKPIIPRAITPAETCELNYELPIIYKPTDVDGYDYSEPTGVTFIPGFGLSIVSPIEIRRIFLANGDYYPELDVERFENDPADRKQLMTKQPRVYFSRLFRFWRGDYQQHAVNIINELVEMTSIQAYYKPSYDAYLAKLRIFSDQVLREQFASLNTIQKQVRSS